MSLQKKPFYRAGSIAIADVKHECTLIVNVLYLFDCIFMLMCSCGFEHFGLEFVTVHSVIKIHIYAGFLK